MEINTAIGVFSALSQETRLDVFQALVKAGPDGMMAGALAKSVDCPASTLSFHLKELLQAQLIRADKQGRAIYYAVDYGGVREMIDFLLISCCDGDPRLTGPYVIKG